jgi:hypothetical protein
VIDKGANTKTLADEKSPPHVKGGNAKTLVDEKSPSVVNVGVTTIRLGAMGVPKTVGPTAAGIGGSLTGSDVVVRLAAARASFPAWHSSQLESLRGSQSNVLAVDVESNNPSRGPLRVCAFVLLAYQGLFRYEVVDRVQFVVERREDEYDGDGRVFWKEKALAIDRYFDDKRTHRLPPAEAALYIRAYLDVCWASVPGMALLVDEPQTDHALLYEFLKQHGHRPVCYDAVGAYKRNVHVSRDLMRGAYSMIDSRFVNLEESDMYLFIHRYWADLVARHRPPSPPQQGSASHPSAAAATAVALQRDMPASVTALHATQHSPTSTAVSAPTHTPFLPLGGSVQQQQHQQQQAIHHARYQHQAHQQQLLVGAQQQMITAQLVGAGTNGAEHQQQQQQQQQQHPWISHGHHFVMDARGYAAAAASPFSEQQDHQFQEHHQQQQQQWGRHGGDRVDDSASGSSSGNALHLYANNNQSSRMPPMHMTGWYSLADPVHYPPLHTDHQPQPFHQAQSHSRHHSGHSTHAIAPKIQQQQQQQQQQEQQRQAADADLLAGSAAGAGLGLSLDLCRSAAVRELNAACPFRAQIGPDIKHVPVFDATQALVLWAKMEDIKRLFHMQLVKIAMTNPSLLHLPKPGPAHAISTHPALAALHS